MPKVSEEHLAARREQILTAAQACFARKGFHNASMNDVFAESGLSAGAVYRYFKSKDELIAALAQRTMTRLGPFFEELLAEDPAPSLEEAFSRFAAILGELSDGPVAIAPQVWAAATYDPAFAPLVSENMRTLRRWWTELARREQKAGGIAADADPEAVAAVMAALMPGYLFQRLVLKDESPDLLSNGLRGLRATPSPS